MLVPNRHGSIEDYRYAFQGQELDPETGMEAFQLRLWDGRIGRWLSPDPYGQNYSPYMGMGNNPIGMIDPDGGYCYDSNGNAIPCGDFKEFNNSTSHMTFLNEVVVTRGTSNASGFSDNSLWRYTPGFGSGLDAYDSFARGDYWTGAFHSALAITDIASLGAGSLATGGLKAAIKVGAKEVVERGGKTIIGETMERVSKEALQHPGAVILNNMPNYGRGTEATSKMMAFNRKWLLDEMRSGRTIIDIGRDVRRTKGLDMKDGISIFYQMEQSMIKNYHKLHPNTLNVIKK